jgi:hypothetical protein
MKKASIPPIALIGIFIGFFAWMAIAYSIIEWDGNKAIGLALILSLVFMAIAVNLNCRESGSSGFIAGISEMILLAAGWYTHFSPDLYWIALGILTVLLFFLPSVMREEEKEWEPEKSMIPEADFPSNHPQPRKIIEPDIELHYGNDGASLQPYWMDEDMNAVRDDEDEAYARQLMELFSQADEQFEKNKNEFKRIQITIHRIGQAIYENGGDERMERVAFILQAMGGKIHDCEFFWDGIGSWKFRTK